MRTYSAFILTTMLLNGRAIIRQLIAFGGVISSKKMYLYSFMKNFLTLEGCKSINSITED